MSEIVVVGSFTAEPGREAEAVAAFEALVEPTHQEDGCILYALHRGTDDPRRLAFVERWASREALDAHLVSPPHRRGPRPRTRALRRERRHRRLRGAAGRRGREGVARRTRRPLIGRP